MCNKETPHGNETNCASDYCIDCGEKVEFTYCKKCEKKNNDKIKILTIKEMMKMVKHDMLEIAGKDKGAVTMTNIIYDELSLRLEGIK